MNKSINSVKDNYFVKFFTELTGLELYQILHLRNQVFIVEQNCVYQDVDFKDLACYHLCFYEKKELIAYCRLVPPNLSYKEVSIGRVIIHEKYRGKGLGYILMEQAILQCKKLFDSQIIKISAQAHLIKFYKNVGFETLGEEYDEDGIPHIEMILNKKGA